MCTATWWSDAGRYELFFSRDERYDRSLGLPPQEHLRNGVSYLCPRDPDGGGTWLLVNQYALTLCLLNQYPTDPAPTLPPRISRGQLVESLACCRKPSEVGEALSAMDIRHYEGFLLLAVGLTSARRFIWDTHELVIGEREHIQQPVTSSSYLADEVMVTRQHLFAEMVAGRGDPSPQKLEAFHKHFMPDASTHSVFMQREDSQTVSLCQVEASAQQVTLAYAPKHPEEQRFLEPVVLSIQTRA